MHIKVFYSVITGLYINNVNKSMHTCVYIQGLAIYGHCYFTKQSYLNAGSKTLYSFLACICKI